MQWLIDLILDKLRLDGLAVNRGDPSAADFTEATMVFDGAWHDMDLSGIIDPNATVVFLFVDFVATAVNKFITFRTKGNANAHNISQTRSSAVGLFEPADLTVFPDANGVIEYNASALGIAIVRITVKGWDF